jgi:hypothetical protein
MTEIRNAELVPRPRRIRPRPRARSSPDIRSISYAGRTAARPRCGPSQRRPKPTSSFPIWPPRCENPFIINSQLKL